MRQNLKTLLMVMSLAVLGATAQANTWALDASKSKLAFGSIKKDVAGEVHTFEKLAGSVAADGVVEIEIDLASVQTNIDIRNERIAEHVFANATTAQVSTTIDMDEMNSLAVGDTLETDIEGTLSFLGQQIEIEFEVFVARLSPSRVMVTTNDMFFISTEDAGIDAGVSKLMELAKLPGITRTVPIVLRLVFDADEQKAEVEPEAPATTEIAFVGDVKAGKKVFKKCKACHSLKADKNGVGPTLHGILGMPAAANSDFKYSKAMAASDLIWDSETMAAFLTKPKKFLPGTKMTFAGLKKEKDITNLIAYINEESLE